MMLTGLARCVALSCLTVAAANARAADTNAVTLPGTPVSGGAASAPGASPFATMASQSIYHVPKSPISIHLLPDLVGGEANGLPVVLNLKNNDLQFFFSANAPAAAAATQPATPDASVLSAQVKPLLFTVKPDSLAPEQRPGYVYALRFKCLDCHNEPIGVVELAKMVGGQVLTGWSWYADADPTKSKTDADAQEQALDTMMSDATVGPPRRPGMPPMAQGPQGSQGSQDHPAGNRPPMHGPGPSAAPPSDSSSTPALSGAAQREAWATAALSAAKKLQSDGNDAAAYERYQYILNEYPKSAAAKDAQTAVTAYQGNADLMAKINPPATRPSAPAAVDPTAKAAGMLSMGENYLAAGQNDLARSKFQAIVDQFPSSPSAAAAKQHLTDLDNAGK